ncbi:methylmalonyl-CoA mutase family protein [Spirosoma rigui]|uniref:methylmalonyl-CoA mutase family protein n=1 Tax=Spirosoma rigui TaxID=564064 RepID=UPI0009AFE1A8|nr:methylmalonyl-CoA mutase family protein [Spirosoma rigui]
MDPLLRIDFPPTPKAAWLAQVQKELKDPSAYETLRWHTNEGFAAEPYYTSDDLTESASAGTSQRVQRSTPGWLNTPPYQLTGDLLADNGALRDALVRGAEALALTIPGETLSDKSAVQPLTRLLNGIKLSDTPVFFNTDYDAAALVKALKTVAPYQLKGGILTDAGTATAEATRLTADSPLFRTVCVGSHDVHEAGGTATQELAFLLAKLTDTYDTLTDAGLSVEQLLPKTILSVSIGTSYFMEIAKLRALRVLFSRLIGHYPTSGRMTSPPFIHARTSAFYEAAATPFTNLLRATTEAMAAVIGGCDALTVHPYDAVLDQKNASPDPTFSDRVARNVSVLLKEESYFDKVADPSAGSYYIENLTSQLVDGAWSLFLNVEQRGGFANALASGFIASELERSYQQQVEAVKQGRVLVGVTKFRHDETERPAPGEPSTASTSLLPAHRLAAEFE